MSLFYMILFFGVITFFPGLHCILHQICAKNFIYSIMFNIQYYGMNLIVLYLLDYIVPIFHILVMLKSCITSKIYCNL